MYKLLFFVFLILVGAFFIFKYNLIAKIQDYITLKHMAHLTSSAFVDNGLIPSLYTCDGTGVNPPLEISDIVGNAQSLVLIVDDPDAPSGTYTHWILYNIPPQTSVIAEKGIPSGAIQGKASSGTIGFAAPCPPAGTHRYIFTLYVLDNMPSVPEELSKSDIEEVMKGHILDTTRLIGRYTKAS